MSRLAGGLFWCYRRDFDSVGGFDENISIGEDVDLARRLKTHGKKLGKKFGKLTKTHIITSCRKFDRFGDWALFTIVFTSGPEIVQGLRGKKTALADKLFYDFKR